MIGVELIEVVFRRLASYSQDFRPGGLSPSFRAVFALAFLSMVWRSGVPVGWCFDANRSRWRLDPSANTRRLDGVKDGERYVLVTERMGTLIVTTDHIWTKLSFACKSDLSAFGSGDWTSGECLWRYRLACVNGMNRWAYAWNSLGVDDIRFCFYFPKGRFCREYIFHKFISFKIFKHKLVVNLPISSPYGIFLFLLGRFYFRTSI